MWSLFWISAISLSTDDRGMQEAMSHRSREYQDINPGKEVSYKHIGFLLALLRFSSITICDCICCGQTQFRMN
jgi:hypothetical protein